MGAIEQIPKPAVVREQMEEHQKRGLLLRRLLKLAIEAHGPDKQPAKEGGPDAA